MKAAAYARYSTDKQTENSIAYQMSAITKYCLDRNIDLCATYSDEAETGTNTNRAGFQALVRAAERHEFDAVVVYDISRGSRDVVDWFAFRKAMKAAGVQVISTTQQLGDITDPSSFLTELVTAGLGQHMVLDTRKKSMAGMMERAKQGLYCGGRIPLGYNVEDGQYIINESEARIVRMIFQAYAAGESYPEILQRLAGKTTKRGRAFSKNSFHSILQNERYIGVFKWNEYNIHIMRKWAGGKKTDNPVILDGIIPPIIDKDTWERVQKRVKDNKRNAANKAKREYLLSGLIECASCGAAYVGHCSTNKRKDGSIRERRYYGCGNKYRSGACQSASINADELELFVVSHIKAAILDWDFDEIARDYADQINGAAPDCEAEKRELADVDAQIVNGTKAALSGVVFPELMKAMDELRGRKIELENIIAEKSAYKGERVKPEDVVAALRDITEEFEPRRAVRELVQKIYVNPDGSCTVHIGVHMTGNGLPKETNQRKGSSRGKKTLESGTLIFPP